MMKRTSFLMLSLAILLFGLVSLLSAKGPEGGDSQKGRLSKVNTNDTYRIFLINNTTNYYSNNGDGSFNPFSQDNEGFEFPKGSNHFCIFESGLVWGGFQKRFDETKATLKVGGSTYYHGIQAGKILTYGTATASAVAESPGLAKNRIFRVRPDIGPKTPFASVKALIEASELPYIQYETYTAQQIYDQYVKDWNEWPAADGAPYNDVNKNGAYDPGTDIPGVPGADQTLWYVANDLDASRTSFISGSQPMGIELQKTIWGYNVSGALANTIFERNLVINKGGARIDSMFFTQWSDPDLGGSGSAGQNAAGCDTTLGLGYVYMAPATDVTFGSTAPASGFDFLQGPVVPGLPTDVAIFKGGTVKGKKNLNMTGYNFFINGNATYPDPRSGSYNGTLDWYNLMNGLGTRTGSAFIDPISGRTTKYTLTGDPVTSSGWLFKQVSVPIDVRMCQTTGPFSMAPADTQEVVVGMLVSQGADHFSSISKLRFDDRAVKAAYAFNFDLASPPPAPVVNVSAMDGTVLLDWSNPTTAAATETYTKKGYNFEGYNVYQIPSKSFNNALRIATYDVIDAVGFVQDLTYDNATGTTLVKTVQYGTDSGLQRFYSTTQDAIKQAGLINGNSYFYAVTAYSYNGTAQQGSLTLESPPQVYEVIPQAPVPGSALVSKAGDVISNSTTVTAIGPPPDGSIIAKVVDPSKVTGDLYKVFFATVGGKKTWGVKDSTTGVTAVSGVLSYGGATSDPIVDGIQFSVLDPGVAGGVKSTTITKLAGADVTPPRNIIRVVSADGNWGIDVAGSTTVATAYTRLDWSGGGLGANDYEVRFTTTGADGSYFYLAAGGAIGDPEAVAAAKAPVQIWDVTNNRRLLLNILDDNTDGKYGETSGGGITALGAGVGWERIYASSAVPYAEPLPSSAVASAAEVSGTTTRLGRFVVVDWKNTGFYPPAGTVVKITTNKPVSLSNAFVLNTSSFKPTTGNTDLAKSAVQNINVWPNPYFGFNRNELNKYQRFVQISHLPARATIRVFNLAGILVRTLAKNDPTQFSRWDLNNESGLPVAAGMYIIYIDMPELGQTKTLKLAVIPETQFLDRY